MTTSFHIEEIDLSTFTGIMFGEMEAEERTNMMPWFWWPDYNDAYNHLYAQIGCDQWGPAGTNGGWEYMYPAKAALDRTGLGGGLAWTTQLVA